MAKNRKDTAKGASARTVGKTAQHDGGRSAGKGGGSPVLRSADTGRFVSKKGASEKSQNSNPYAGLTKVAGKVRVRDPYTSESW